jgi:beta-1,4-N-acetylglucosaminyltransferase
MWLNFPLLVVVKYWFFQGNLYMNRVELFHRWTLELTVFALVYWLLAGFYAVPAAAITAALVAHTLNATLNGQVVAVLAHDNKRLSLYRDPVRFVAYVEGIEKRLSQCSPLYLREVLVFGSLTRGIFRETSDLDIRFIAADGFWNALRAAHYVFIERARACLCGFPLDAYMFRTRDETERKMRVHEERAICLYRRKVSEPPVIENSLPLSHVKTGIINAPAVRKPPRVIVIGAGGGHLLEALLATEGVPMRRVIATYRLPHTAKSLKGERCYFLVDPHGNLIKYLINAIQSLWMVLRERPHAVISTGGGISIATALFSKLFGSKLIYVESGARVRTPSRTGDLLYRFADLFIVQWEPMLQRYPNAVHGGVLL